LVSDIINTAFDCAEWNLGSAYVLMVSIGAFENGPIAPDTKPRIIVCQEGNSTSWYSG
jgi:hypothetical protein